MHVRHCLQKWLKVIPFLSAEIEGDFYPEHLMESGKI